METALILLLILLLLGGVGWMGTPTAGRTSPYALAAIVVVLVLLMFV